MLNKDIKPYKFILAFYDENDICFDEDIFEPKDFDYWYSSYKDYNENPPISGDHIRIFALIKETNQSILIFE